MATQRNIFYCASNKISHNTKLSYMWNSKNYTCISGLRTSLRNGATLPASERRIIMCKKIKKVFCSLCKLCGHKSITKTLSPTLTNTHSSPRIQHVKESTFQIGLHNEKFSPFSLLFTTDKISFSLTAFSCIHFRPIHK